MLTRLRSSVKLVSEMSLIQSYVVLKLKFIPCCHQLRIWPSLFWAPDRLNPRNGQKELNAIVVHGLPKRVENGLVRALCICRSL